MVKGLTITLTITYDPESLPDGASEEELYIAYWDSTEWVAVESTVDTEANTVSAELSHFTQFAVIGTVTPPVEEPVEEPVVAAVEELIEASTETPVEAVVEEVVEAPVQDTLDAPVEAAVEQTLEVEPLFDEVTIEEPVETPTEEITEAIEETGLGRAIMDRLYRASAKRSSISSI